MSKKRKLFNGFTFTIVGELESGKSHDVLGKMIRKLGGSYLEGKLRNHVTHVVSSPTAFSNDHYKIRRARRRKMKIVHENFVLHSHNNKKRYNAEDYSIDKFIVPKVIPVKSTKPTAKKSKAKRQAIDDILPMEIWREVLFFITTKDLLLQISLINQSFHNTIDSETFWGALCLRKLKFPFLCNRNRNQSKFPEKMKTMYDHLGEQNWKKVHQLLPERRFIFDHMDFCFFPISEHRPLRISRKEYRRNVENAFHFQNSKMGGYPLLLKGEEWPKCKICGKYLKFFYQINTDELPDSFPKSLKLPKNSLFQFFYCAEDEHDINCSFEPWKQDNKRFRWIRNLDQVGDGRGKYDIYKYLKKNPWTEYLITGWEMSVDWPSGEFFFETDVFKEDSTERKTEIEKLRKEFPKVSEENQLETYGGVRLKSDDDFFIDCLEDFLRDNRPDGRNGLKLLGFGGYVQGEEPGECPNCKKKRRLFTELDESKELPLMWGDGAGWIHVCEDCPEKSLSYDWSCS